MQTVDKSAKEDSKKKVYLTQTVIKYTLSILILVVRNVIQVILLTMLRGLSIFLIELVQVLII